MRNRRLQIGMISLHIVESWGKELGTQIRDLLPDDARVVTQEKNINRACMDLLIHHESFDDVPGGNEIPRIILSIPLKEQEEKTNLIYDH